MPKSYEFGKWIFGSQSSLEAAIKGRLQRLPMNQEATDDLILDVINNLHPDVVLAQQVATKLCYLDYMGQLHRGMKTAESYRGGKVMTAWFVPLQEWRDVTVYPWRKGSNQAEIKAAFRSIIAAYLPKPEPHHRCSMPNCTAEWKTLEYQHVSPTFNEIVVACLELCSETEVETKFGYNKFDYPSDTYSIADVIPATHPAVRHLIRAHQSNQWAWLCPEHHRGVKPPAQLRLETAAD